MGVVLLFWFLPYYAFTFCSLICTMIYAVKGIKGIGNDTDKHFQIAAIATTIVSVLPAYALWAYNIMHIENNIKNLKLYGVGNLLPMLNIALPLLCMLPILWYGKKYVSCLSIAIRVLLFAGSWWSILFT